MMRISRCRSKPLRREIVGELAQGGVELAGGGQVVDRLGQRAAEQEGPDAIDGRAGEVRIPRSTTQAASCSRGLPDPGRSSGQNGTRGSTSTGSLVLRSGGR